MKKPQKPKSWRKIFEKNRKEIFKLLDNEEITAFITTSNQKYLHWDELRQRNIPQKINPELVWALMKMFRQQEYRNLKFNKFNLKYSLSNTTLQRLHLLDKSAGGHLESGSEMINLESMDRYIISSLMEEAIATSQLEGAVTTRKIAKEMLRKRKKPKTYSEHMIVNGYQTIQKITQMTDKKLTIDLILEFQRDITKDTLKNKEDEGRFRDNTEVVLADANTGTVYHTPPDFKKVQKLMENFCNFANDDSGEFIHPIIKGILLHFLIGYIHPFNDGNGRTARAIFYWYVLSRGYWLFEFMSISRILIRSRVNYNLSYIYTETDENDLTYFINHNLKAIEKALEDMKEYLTRKQKDQAEAMKIIESSKELNLRQADMLKRFMKNSSKLFSIREIGNTYDIVYQTARTDLMHLTKLNHIVRVPYKNKFLFRLKEK